VLALNSALVLLTLHVKIPIQLNQYISVYSNFLQHNIFIIRWRLCYTLLPDFPISPQRALCFQISAKAFWRRKNNTKLLKCKWHFGLKIIVDSRKFILNPEVKFVSTGGEKTELCS
jgi:hypothetical protein